VLNPPTICHANEFFVISSEGARFGHPELKAKDPLGRSEKSARSDFSGKNPANRKKSLRVDPSLRSG
jgi:hypothetical protein